MDYRKTDAPTNTQTRNITEFAKGTNNIYESVVIMSRRANQISVAMKNDLQKKLQEFASANENLAEQEFIDDRLYYRNPTTGEEGIV